MTRLSYFVTSLVALLVGVSADAQERAAAKKPPIKPIVLRDGAELSSPEVCIPIHHHTGHLAIDVMVNGKGPFRFQLDTGASASCVDPSLIAKLGLAKVGSVWNSSAIDPTKRSRRDRVKIDELKVGGVTFRNLTAIGIDFSWVEKRKKDRVFGLLGFPLFRELLLSIDYPNSQIILTRGALDKKAAHVISYRGGDGTPRVPIKVGKTTLLPSSRHTVVAQCDSVRFLAPR